MSPESCRSKQQQAVHPELLMPQQRMRRKNEENWSKPVEYSLGLLGNLHLNWRNPDQAAGVTVPSQSTPEQQIGSCRPEKEAPSKHTHANSSVCCSPHKGVPNENSHNWNHNSSLDFCIYALPNSWQQARPEHCQNGRGSPCVHAHCLYSTLSCHDYFCLMTSICCPYH